MQINKLLWLVVPAVLSGGTGCVYTHHPAAYSAVTTDAAVGTPTTVVATSPRPAVRVYAEPSSKMSITTPVPPPVTTTVVPGHIVATSNPADVAITSSIRQMLEADTARIYRNVDFAIDNATVTLRGTVPTDHDRIELQNRLVTMPGVAAVENKLDVEIR